MQMQEEMSSSVTESKALNDDQSPAVLEDKSAFQEDESEDDILHMKAKLYIYDSDEKQWKEKGAGLVKFLKHKESGRVRLLMRVSESDHIILNHSITPKMDLEEYAGEEYSCMWRANAYEDGELKEHRFRMEFTSDEDWEAFIGKFEDVSETQSKKEENEDTNVAAGFLEKVTASEAESKPELHVK